MSTETAVEQENGPSGRSRGDQIHDCFLYGLLPWWCYERTCHYRPWSYWQHLAVNMRLAWDLLRGREG